MNPLQLAEEYVLETSQHVFLTGKAGTGKTTFLKNIVAKTAKKFVVVAPTAVAAINAGGMTIHSLFQLPPGIFVPEMHYRGYADIAVHDRRSLLEHMRMSDSKLTLIRELQLLIIDEVSMLNADLLDAIDFILKTIRRNKDKAFGGVQVLLIGDLYQLPPVVSEQSETILLPWYRSSYFYQAQVMQESPSIYIPLDKIYRQSDQRFIHLLNNIRNNTLSNHDYEWLSGRYSPDNPIDWENNIILTTHNWKADKINASQLEKISGDVMTYHAEVEGEINPKSVAADIQLHLKSGAQVMFVKNDSSGQHRYYNGRLATVRKVRSDSITVVFADNNEDFELERESWENVRYAYNEMEDTVQSKIIGTFTQYPIRLAWAVTIHKSQGLTFDKVVIDAASAFAAGQVYVALSRCTTMEGLRLMSPIGKDAISTDKHIVAWTASQELTMPQHICNLPLCKWQHLQERIALLYDWQKLITATVQCNNMITTKAGKDKGEILAITEKIIINLYHQQQTADKFLNQIKKIFELGNSESTLAIVQERNNKALAYFIQEIKDHALIPLAHVVEKKMENGNKSVKKAIAKLIETLEYKILNMTEFSLSGQKMKRTVASSTGEGKISMAKPIKQDTKLLTLQLFKEGKSLEQIAKERNLASQTIVGHLSYFVERGEVEAQDIISQEKLSAITAQLSVLSDMSLKDTKERLEIYSYEEIKIAQAFRIFIAKG